jgi:hypothetical protein
MKRELAPGDPELIGPYRLRGRLGAGGMGQVYLGLSPGGRAVAVKVIRAELAQDPEFRARFQREVAVARQVSGLYTAPVLDADTSGPAPWLATAYVPGPSLADAVTRHGPLPAASVLMLAAGLAEALSAIHSAGVVHRDLKPANVLLADDGPRVIDFGISRAAEASSLTHTGLVVGSPGFMSPEQAEGLETGPSSDIFSLGAVLTFAATGRGPFGSGSTPAQVYRVVHDAPELDLVPAEIRPLIARCLAKDPAGRPTAADLLAGAAYPAQDWLPEPVTRTFRRDRASLAPTRCGGPLAPTRDGGPLAQTSAGLGAAAGSAASAGLGASAELAASAGWGASAGLATSASLAASAGLAASGVPATLPGGAAIGYGTVLSGPGFSGGAGRPSRRVRWRPFAVAAVLAALIGGGGGAAFALTGAPAHTAPSARQVAGAAPPAAAAPTSRAPDAAAASSSPASAAAGTRSSATPPAYAPPASTTPTYVPPSTQSASPSVPPASAPPSSRPPSSPPPSTAPSPVTSPSPGTSSGTPPPTSFPDVAPPVAGQRDLLVLAVRLASACSPAGVPGDGALEGSR